MVGQRPDLPRRTPQSLGRRYGRDEPFVITATGLVDGGSLFYLSVIGASGINNALWFEDCGTVSFNPGGHPFVSGLLEEWLEFDLGALIGAGSGFLFNYVFILKTARP